MEQPVRGHCHGLHQSGLACASAAFPTSYHVGVGRPLMSAVAMPSQDGPPGRGAAWHVRASRWQVADSGTGHVTRASP